MKDYLHTTPQLDGYAKHTVDPTVAAQYKLRAYTSSDGYVISEPIPAHRLKGYSVTVSCPATGSPNGSVKLQLCNDQERQIAGGNFSDSNLVNWVDVASGGSRIVSGSIANASVVHLTDPECFYRWFRVVYARTSGTITITVNVQGKTEE